MSVLKVGAPEFVPALIIFDKDGTLIDFNFMWAGWIVELARRLENFTGICITEELYRAFGFDPIVEKVFPTGALALASMATLREMAVDVLSHAGLARAESIRAVDAAWFVPDPIASTRGLTDLPQLFQSLHERGIKIAVITADDRAPTAATLRALGIAEYVDALVGADDTVPMKPAPDTVFHVCKNLKVPLARTLVVGDAINELKMARAAGVGLVVGVLSGVSSAEILAPYADMVIGSVAELI